MSTNALLSGIIPVPTMSTKGLVYDSSNKIDTLLAHAFQSDHNQTYLYYNNITSLAAFIAQGGTSSSKVIDNIRRGLVAYLSKYYTNADADVKVVTNDASALSAQVTLGITLTIVENQAQMQEYRLVALQNGSLLKVINLDNTGVYE